MSTITVPEASGGMNSATVTRWWKQRGESVQPGDLVVELEIEHAFVHLEAAVPGVLQKVAAVAGTTVPVGGLLGELNHAEAASPAAIQPAAGAPPAPAAGGDPSNVTPVLMPQAGNTMEEGTVLTWLVAEGDTIAVGQIICEIETDKATIEFEAPDGGRLARIVAGNDQTVAVKEPIALLADNDADADAFLNAAGVGVAAGTAVAAASPGSPSAVEAGPAPVGPEGVVVPVLMPQAGNTMEEGTVLAWRVSEGDIVKVGQIICEIETDKATIEFEAPDEGRLARIVAGDDETVAVKEPIAYLADNDADVDAYLAVQAHASDTAAAGTAPGPQAAAPTAAVVATAGRAAASPTTDGQRIKASPAARRLAGQRGLKLASVGVGSGPGGRILSTDLDRAVAAQAAPAAEVTPDGAIRRPMSKMRWAIAANLTKSKQTVPHFYCRMTFDAGPLFSFYREQKAETGCTINDVITLACGRVIQEMPVFRSQVQERDLVEFPHANIGIAVGMDEGLVVPVVPAVDEMTLGQLASEARRIVERARSGKLDNIGTGVFTISNLGMFGVEEFAAIINPPEAAILAVSALREEMIVENGEARAGKVMTMTLSTDHRVIDGVAGAKFLARLKEIFLAPQELLS